MGQRKIIKAASLRSVGDVKAKKVLADLRQLCADLDDLYMADEEMYDSLDLDSLFDEARAATMFVAHQIEGE